MRPNFQRRFVRAARIPAGFIFILVIGAFSLRGQTPSGSPGVAAFKKLTLAELMDVEVTSVSRRVERLSQTPSAIQVASSDELRRSGASRLPSALRLFSNLAVAQVDSRQWAITARGFNNTLANKMLVLLDGRTIYTPLYAGVFWDAQDTFMPDLDRIEVISGPGATQWGSNAVNGVINITSKHARDTQGGLLMAGVGVETKTAVGIRYGGAVTPNVHYRAYAQRNDHDSSVLRSGQDAGDAWDHSQAGFRMDWDAASGGAVTVQGDLYSGRAAATAGSTKTEGGNLLGRWTLMFAPDSGIRVQAYYDKTFRRIRGSFAEDLDTVDLDFQHQLPLFSQHNLVWGLNLRTVDDEVTNSPTIAFLPANVERTWRSLFIQDTITLPNSAWRLTLGSKFEDNPYTGTEIQPTARIAWSASPSVLVWGAVSRAARTPSRIDREVFSPGVPPFVIAGGPNFMSEKLVAWELGLRSRVGQDFTYSLSTFYHAYDDLRSVEPIGGGTSVLANGIVGKSYGAELSANFAVTDTWALRLGYTEMRVQSRPKPGSLDATSVRSQSLDPNHQLLLVSQHTLFERFLLDGTLRYVAPLRNQQVPGYTELDARLGWQFNADLEFAVVGRNLLHPRHQEFGTPAAGRLIERHGSVTMTWRF